MALNSLAILDTAPEASFDALVATGRALFDVSSCLVSLIDKDRQWFKARSGLDANQTPRDISFCGHAILESDVFVIPDARADERFHDNPLVAGPPHIRFYAGAQIRLPSGYTIGTVCLLSPEPRADFNDEQRTQLRGLATLAIEVLAARALRAELDRERVVIERQKLLLEAAGRPLALLSADGVIQDATMAFEDLFDGAAEVGQTFDAALKALGHAGGFNPSATDATEITLADGNGCLRVEPDMTGFVVYPA